MIAPQQYGALIQQNRGTDEYLNQQQFGANLGLQAGQAFTKSFQAAQAKKEAQDRQNSMIEEYRGLGDRPDPLAVDEYMMRYPEGAKQLQQSLSSFSENERGKLATSGAKAYMSAMNGKPELASKELKELSSAYRNSGQEEKADIIDNTANMIDQNPLSAEKNLYFLNAQLFGDKFKNLVKERAAIDKLTGEESRAAGMAETDLETKKQNLAKIKYDFAKSKRESTGDVPEEKRVDTEFKLRKEYSDQTKEFKKVRDSYGRIGASQDNAAGDIALVFNYMKMLDPGSVVRESEFSIAQNADSLPGILKNHAMKIGTGERLNAGQRKMFKDQAEKLFSSSKKEADIVKNGIKRFATNMNLNKDNIFYEREDIAEGGTVPPAGSRIRKWNPQTKAFE